MYFMLGTPHLVEAVAVLVRCQSLEEMGLQESQWQGVALSLDILYAEQT